MGARGYARGAYRGALLEPIMDPAELLCDKVTTEAIRAITLMICWLRCYTDPNLWWQLRKPYYGDTMIQVPMHIRATDSAASLSVRRRV